jgi:predicted transcriptional regulator
MTEETTRAFLLRLWELQEERGLGNKQIAILLGISPSYVRRLKTRERIRSIGYQIALRAVREFPELALFLSADLPSNNERAIICKPPETTESEA